jgi:hypothetical protein
MRSQFGVNLNNLFYCAKLSFNTSTSGFYTPVPTVLGDPLVSFAAVEEEQ